MKDLTVFLNIRDKNGKVITLSSSSDGMTKARTFSESPRFERWLVIDNSKGYKYDLQGIDRQGFLYGVKCINRGSTNIPVDTVVLVGYYNNNFQSPYIIRSLNTLIPSTEPIAGFGQWPYFRQSLGRSSATGWTEIVLSSIGSISKTWDSEIPDIRAWNGQLVVPFLGSHLRFSTGEHWPEFYDSDYLPPHYNTIGSDVDDFILDPSDEGSILTIGDGYIERVSRADMSPIWSTELGSVGTVLPKTLFSVGNVIGFLSSISNRLHLTTFSPEGTKIATVLLQQSKEPDGGFLEGEAVAMLSGNSAISPGNGAGFVTYWDPESPSGSHNVPANPWGFLNAAGVGPNQFNNIIQNQRNYGRQISTIAAREFHWGEPAGQFGVLHFVQLDGVLGEGQVIVPRPPDNQYLPTLIAYNTDGSVLWEKLGWEYTEDDFPYHYRDFFCPVMISEGRLLVVRLKLTFKTIDETFVFIDEETDSWTGDPDASPPDNYKPSLAEDETVLTVTFSEGASEVRRSRRIVGAQTFHEVFELSSGAVLSSSANVPQVTSQFVTRGEFQGSFPAEYAFQALAPVTSNELAHLGYTPLTTYWPTPENFFTLLFGGTFYTSGLYAATNNRVPPPWLWPANLAQPGYAEDSFEADPWFDPLNNNAYNRIHSPGSTFSFGEWGVRGDFNNNGSPDVRTMVPPPSAFRYEAVFHDYNYDLPHFSDHFNPVSNSDKSLIILPPVNILGSAFSSQVLPGRKFAASSGSNEYYSWSGGTVANRMAHSITVTHFDWQTDERQIWVARDWLGNITWKHFIESSELPGLIYNDPFFGPISTHQFSRPCCANGKMYVVHRVKDSPYRLRVVNDLTGALISDTELTMIEGHLEEGDNGGAPHELIMAGDVAILTTREDIVVSFSFETFDFVETQVGKPHVLELYSS